MNTVINTEEAYLDAAAKIEVLLRMGFKNLTESETEKLEILSKSVAVYEKEFYPIQTPDTISEMLELKMYELRISQKKLSELLNISPNKLSLILKGKSTPNIAILKAAHQQLGIDASFLLNHA